MHSPSEVKRVIEAALLASPEPLGLPELKRLFDGDLSADTLRNLLTEIGDEWKGRAVELVHVASGWRFQTTTDFTPYVERLAPEKPPKYSRAVMETLAIIAYRQPVTRGDIEDIRGVAVASSVMKQLEDRGWIEAIGYREAPGRPALLATTRHFLDDLGLSSLDQLPTLAGADGEPPVTAIGEGVTQGSLSFVEPAADAAGESALAQPPADAAALEPHA